MVRRILMSMWPFGALILCENPVESGSSAIGARCQAQSAAKPACSRTVDDRNPA